jgi:hypothetical protein
MVLMLLGGTMSDRFEDTFAELPRLSNAILEQRWKELFKTDPPANLRRSLLLPILAYKMQEQNFGSISRSCRARLRQLAQSTEDQPNCVSVTPTLKPGTRLVRKWSDEVHLVNVESNGYEYQGQRYQSLSEIARLITGTRWSGPLFFGLKAKQQNTKSKAAL